MGMTKVSIIIPVYNGADFLAQAIDSALTQTWENLEIIVVNDGSNDGGATEKVAKAYGNRIRYISKPNGGVASALNTGIANMTGEYFSWLSHDDLYLPNKVKHQMELLKRLNDPLQIVAGGYYIVNEKLQPLGVMDFYKLYTKEELQRPLFPVFHCAVNGCTLLIHKSHFDRIGNFREDLPTTQDYDLWFRMLRGQKLYYGKAIDVVSRDHEKQTSKIQKDAHEQECTSLWNNLIEQLTDAERIRISGSIEAFNVDLYQHFSQRTSYEILAKNLRMKCKGKVEEKKLLPQPLPIGKKRWFLRRELQRYVK